MGIFRAGAHGKFIHIELSQQDAIPKPLGHMGIIGRNEVFQHFGGAGCGNSPGAEIVFERHGNASQRAQVLPLCPAGIYLLGLAQCLLFLHK